jgi:transposase InsO family protein
MRRHRIQGLRLRRRVPTTIADPAVAKAPGLIDLHSRRLVGWVITDHMRTDLVIDALHAAERTRGSLDAAIFHSDHGQHTSNDFAAACQRAGVRQSMSKVGSYADNALAESFNASFKRETLQGRRTFTDEREARLASFRWPHRSNTIRRHSKLGTRLFLRPTFNATHRTNRDAHATLEPGTDQVPEFLT